MPKTKNTKPVTAVPVPVEPASTSKALKQIGTDTNQLSKAEVKQREQYEAVVEENKASFIETAVALTMIQDQKLYRDQGTFAEYCEARFDLKRAYAYKLIAAGKIQDELKELGAPEIANESQARLLSKIPSKEQRAEVMEKAKELAGDGEDIRAQHISAAIKEVGPKVKAMDRKEVKKIGSNYVQKWLQTVTALHKRLLDEYGDSENEIGALAKLKAEIQTALGIKPEEGTIVDVEAKVTAVEGSTGNAKPEDDEDATGADELNGKESILKAAA